VRAAPVFLRLNHLSTTNRMALMAAPNNLRSRIPMNLRGRMSVSYSEIHETAPQDDSYVEKHPAWVQRQKAHGWQDDQRTEFLEAHRRAVATVFTSLLASCRAERTTAGVAGETPEG
jgi:hypothetical protein